MKTQARIHVLSAALCLGVCTMRADDIDDLVNATYDRLTPEERVAQICSVTAGEITGKDGKFSIEKARAAMPHGIGHVCQFACNRVDEPSELAAFVDAVQDFCINESSAHISAICHEEVISGLAARTATTYPQQIGIAASWDTALMEEKCRQTREAMLAVGAAFALSPMADVIVNSNWTRLEEGYGESGYLSAAMGSAFVKGLQGEASKSGRIIVGACTKHFLGYGVIGGGEKCSWRDIYEEVIYPHEAMINGAGAAAVMTSYDSFKGEQAVSSPTLLQYLLRKYIGFRGTVVSDYGAVVWDTKKVAGEEKTALLKKRAADAIRAGNDVDLPHGAAYKYARDCVREGLVTEEELERCVKNSLRLKARLGLLDKVPARALARNAETLDRPDWRNTARKLAGESVVLLKNDGLLPLKSGVKKVALVGPNANSCWAMLGDYTYQCMQAFWRRNVREWDSPHIVTLKEGLERALGDLGIELAYERGCDWSKPGDVGVSAGGDPRTESLSLKVVQSADKADFDAAVRIGREADVVICAVGENFTLCGESRQRPTIRLAGDQERLVRAMIAAGKRVVLVHFGGRNEVLGDLVDGCGAVLQAWYPGEEGGNAVADILTGAVNPSGKLPISYPKSESREMLAFWDGSDTAERVQWPFGFGLSYTSFAYSESKEASSVCALDLQKAQGSFVEVSCMIENTGEYDGTETAQLYIVREGDCARLRGFGRVELKRGEKKCVSWRVPVELFAHWQGEKFGEWVVSPGSYELRIGASAWDIKCRKRVEFTGEALHFARRKAFFSECKVTDAE